MGQSMRVFIIEDEALLQMELEMFIEDAGHAVAGVATSLREAHVFAKQMGADVALVDIHLADGPTGIEAGRMLASRGLPVVFVTANAARLPDDFVGALGVIGKPYSQAGIVSALKYIGSALQSQQPSLPPPPSLTLAPAMAQRWASATE